MPSLQLNSPSISVAVVGASGYAGGELVRLVDGHPKMQLGALVAHTAAGRALSAVHPHLSAGDRILEEFDLARVCESDLVFLALPHGASAGLAVAILEEGKMVVDLGSDFRIDELRRYEAVYGDGHPHPDQLGAWPYGLPEFFGAAIAATDRVAAPGCYPTAVGLSLAPLVASSIVDPQTLVVDAMSGASGAGRVAHPNLTYGAIGEGVRAYQVTTHRHRSEMEQVIGRVAGIDPNAVKLAFTPHLVPMQRGILATSSAKLTGSGDAAIAVMESAYGGEPFVDVVADPPSTRWVVGSNRCMLSVHIDSHTDRVIVTAAIDNLLKGAAGQALQCSNLMLGLDQAAGLTTVGWMP